MKIGDRVKFKNVQGVAEYLNGETGTIEDSFALGWIVNLDNDLVGHYSGRSWARESELEVIEQKES